MLIKVLGSLSLILRNTNSLRLHEGQIIFVVDVPHLVKGTRRDEVVWLPGKHQRTLALYNDRFVHGP